MKPTICPICEKELPEGRSMHDDCHYKQEYERGMNHERTVDFALYILKRVKEDMSENKKIDRDKLTEAIDILVSVRFDENTQKPDPKVRSSIEEFIKVDREAVLEGIKLGIERIAREDGRVNMDMLQEMKEELGLDDDSFKQLASY